MDDSTSKFYDVSVEFTGFPTDEQFDVLCGEHDMAFIAAPDESTTKALVTVEAKDADISADLVTAALFGCLSELEHTTITVTSALSEDLFF